MKRMRTRSSEHWSGRVEQAHTAEVSHVEFRSEYGQIARGGKVGWKRPFPPAACSPGAFLVKHLQVTIAACINRGICNVYTDEVKDSTDLPFQKISTLSTAHINGSNNVVGPHLRANQNKIIRCIKIK